MLTLCHHHQSSDHPSCILLLVPHTTHNVSGIPRTLLPTVGKLANALDAFKIGKIPNTVVLKL